MNIDIDRLEEMPVPGHRLGRHVRHDPRSWAFPAPMAAEIRTVKHERRVPIFDQGATGSCTGEAGIGCISTGPFTHRGTQAEAVALYSDATRDDGIFGVYPPTDTGSSGLAVCRVLKRRGWIDSYSHAFKTSYFLRALVLRPGILGMTWRSGCDRPNAVGVVQYSGEVRGGHEVCAVGLDVAAELVWFANSWGASWGKAGFFAVRFRDLDAIFADRGDARFPSMPVAA